MKKVLIDTNIIVGYIYILGVDKTIIIRALNSNWKDFEDAVQGNVAKENSLDLIVTRNTKDFAKMEGVQIVDPIHFLTKE